MVNVVLGELVIFCFVNVIGVFERREKLIILF